MSSPLPRTRSPFSLCLLFLGLFTTIYSAEPLPPPQPLPQSVLDALKRPPLTTADPLPPRAIPSPIFEPTLSFSTTPSDFEISSARVFGEPLVPMPGNSTPAENKALSSALLNYRKTGGPENVSALTAFLQKYPGSKWRAALELNLGILSYQTGYFSAALAHWEAAWERSQNADNLGQKAVADRAISEFLFLNAKLGRIEVLKPRLEAVAKRQFDGSNEARIVGAQEGLKLMTEDPGVAFRCGPFAVNSILEKDAEAPGRHPVIAAAQSTAQGTSLWEVRNLAASVGMNYQMAVRKPGAQIIVPCVVHWKVGHFGALLRYQDGKYLLQDPTFGTGELWISAKALDQEASGYFLVPAGKLPKGWTAATEAQAKQTWGRGGASFRDEDAKTVNHRRSPCDSKGMAVATVFNMQATLRVEDTPFFYYPPLGPAMEFTLAYNHLETNEPTNYTFTNFGPNWNFNWLAYLTVDPSRNIVVKVRGGGSETYKFSRLDNLTQTYAPDLTSQAIIAVVGDTYERRLPDGSKEVYAQKDGTGRYFMTQVVDPQGNPAYINFDTTFRITSIVDGLGWVNFFYYYTDDVNIPLLYYKPILINNPTAGESSPHGHYMNPGTGPFVYFGIGASGANIALTAISDPASIVSSFSYDDTGFLGRLQTPYGVTLFEKYEFTFTDIGFNEFIARGLKTTYPDASQIRVESWIGHTNQSYFWDQKATPYYPDRSKAQATKYIYDGNVQSSVAKSTKNALEGEIRYEYPGQSTGLSHVGTLNKPSALERTLDDGSIQRQEFEYNRLGKIIKQKDPSGRSFNYYYAPNSIDLLEIRQTRNGSNELLGKWIYNTQHRPTKFIDSAGRQTNYTYNGKGQVLTVTNPKAETTTYSYQNDYLYTINGPLAGNTDKTTVYFTLSGMLSSVVDPKGLTTTYYYDTLRRLQNVVYPDASFDTLAWDKLDLAMVIGRDNRTVVKKYNSVRQLISETDAEGRTTSFDWCGCGSLNSYTDPEGRTTSFIRDVQGRVTSRVYPDSKTIGYTYKPQTGWLDTITDAKGQVAHHAYFPDGSLQEISYTNATYATSTTSYTYDPDYLRLKTATNGWGTLTYDYYPYITDPYATPVLGAGLLSKVQHSAWANSDLTYAYDELGRITHRKIDGDNNKEIYGYDATGRLSTLTNPLGAFGFAYKYTAEGLPELDEVSYPNGQTVKYDWWPNEQDRRLKEIINKASSVTELSRFNYSYRPTGEITAWTQQFDSGSAKRYDFEYDDTDQLTGAVLSAVVGGGVLKRNYYQYDDAGNRVSEQIDAVVQQAAHNNVNQLSSRSAGGPTRVQGTLNEAGTVTVAVNSGAAAPATMLTGKDFIAYPNLSTGSNTVAVTAKDGSNNTSTKQWQVTVPTGSTLTLSYDDNGNLLNDGAGHTYEWDAADRLLAINTGATLRTEFTYDPMGRRVKIVEKSSGTVVSTKHHLWAEDAQPVEERDASNVVTKRFYAHGMQVGTAKYFYTQDHLGSIRELTDDTKAIRARYDYDPFGRRTKVQGDLDADFGFTGHYYHSTSGLSLTLFRAYDSNQGRWLSRDPIGETDDLNTYAYVSNNPIYWTDPTGLMADEHWHHLLVQAQKEWFASKGININDRECGWMLAGDVHIGKGSPHRAWNAEWKTFKKLNPGASKQQIWNKLNKLFADDRFSDWLAKGVPAPYSYSQAKSVRGSAHIGTIGVVAAAAISSVAVINLAVNAQGIACDLVKDVINIKNGMPGAELDLHQHMQEIAPGFIGHLAFLKVYGEL